MTTFAADVPGSIERRRNERYDEIMQQISWNEEELQYLVSRHEIREAKLRHIQNTKGHKGPCILRKLKHFDVGKSFLVDSLHNIYLGVFVSS